MTTFDEKMVKAHRKLGAKLGKNYYGNVYIGVTTNIERRKKRYDNMDDFVILYETSSRNFALKAEQHLIEYARDNYGSKDCNVRKGGEGLIYGADKYYVYAAMGNSCRLKGS